MAILNVISTRNYEFSSYADYEFYPNEPEIIEIYLTYITRTRQIVSYPAAYVGYFGFKPYASIDDLVQGFLETQALYRCRTGIRARHEWVSFKAGETLDGYGRNRVVDIAYQFALWYFKQGFQVVFAIHTDTEYLHIHYVINSVNFLTGRKYHSNTHVLLNEKKYLEDVIQYCTGKREKDLNILEYTNGYENLVNDKLIFQQMPLPAVLFPYVGKRKINYGGQE